VQGGRRRKEDEVGPKIAERAAQSEKRVAIVWRPPNARRRAASTSTAPTSCTRPWAPPMACRWNSPTLPVPTKGAR
jgi:hypothetical protein